MSLSFWQILLVVVLFMLLFGRGKIPALMSDVASGIKGFKKAMHEDDEANEETREGLDSGKDTAAVEHSSADLKTPSSR